MTPSGNISLVVLGTTVGGNIIVVADGDTASGDIISVAVGGIIIFVALIGTCFLSLTFNLSFNTDELISAHLQRKFNMIMMNATLCLKNVTRPDKTGLIALFCILRRTDFNIECTVLLWWLDTVTPDILYNKCSYIAIIS